MEDWLKTIMVRTERVLDLGGASNPVRNRVAKWDVQECVFFDNGSEEAKVSYVPFDINKPLTQFGGFLPQDLDRAFKFDAVFCLEVFEYVYDPMQAMKNIWDLMNNDSVAYISFPAIYPVHNPADIDYLRFTRKSIEKYLELLGFTQVEIKPRVATLGREHLAMFYASEKMHPLRKSNLPYDIGYLVKARKLVY